MSIPKYRSVTVAIALTFAVILLVALRALSGGDADSSVYGDKEIAPGTYAYAASYAHGVEMEVSYVDHEHWLQVVGDNDQIGAQWVARVGSTVYDVDHGSGEVLVIRDVEPDLVPEGFLLDPLFLDRASREGLEGTAFEGNVRMSGEASVSAEGLTVPRVLEVRDERFEVVAYDDAVAAEPEAEVERLLDDPGYEAVEESELPRPDLESYSTD